MATDVFKNTGEIPLNVMGKRAPMFERVWARYAVAAADPAGEAFREPVSAADRKAWRLRVRAARASFAAFRKRCGYVERSRNLLSSENLKLGKDKRALAVGLSLSPADSSGYNVCPCSTRGCRFGCVASSGFGRFRSAQYGRAVLTVWAAENPDAFTALLVHELRLAVKRAARQGLPLAARLNVFSDVHWFKLLPWLAAEFPTVEFYAYTKRADIRDSAPENLAVSWSYSERDARKDFPALMAAADTVSVVLDVPAGRPLPDTFRGFPVIDGDRSDLRSRDPRGHVVGLRAKGRLLEPDGRRVGARFVQVIEPASGCEGCPAAAGCGK